MMIELRAIGLEDKEYDICGSTTHAVLEINNMIIPLCGRCLDELIEEVNKFQSKVYCHECKHFCRNGWGEWRYGGTCKKIAEKEGIIELIPENCGLYYGKADKGCMDSCEEGEKDETF